MHMHCNILIGDLCNKPWWFITCIHSRFTTFTVPSVGIRHPCDWFKRYKDRFSKSIAHYCQDHKTAICNVFSIQYLVFAKTDSVIWPSHRLSFIPFGCSAANYDSIQRTGCDGEQQLSARESSATELVFNSVEYCCQLDKRVSNWIKKF